MQRSIRGNFLVSFLWSGSHSTGIDVEQKRVNKSVEGWGSWRKKYIFIYNIFFE
jgi:hypothetical protein